MMCRRSVIGLLFCLGLALALPSRPAKAVDCDSDCRYRKKYMDILEHCFDLQYYDCFPCSNFAQDRCVPYDIENGTCKDSKTVQQIRTRTGCTSPCTNAGGSTEADGGMPVGDWTMGIFRKTCQVAGATDSSTSLSASATTIFCGSSVTFTAAISVPWGGATPTGSMSFYDGDTFLGSSSLSTSMMGGAQGTLTTSTLATGSHSIVAVYSGDANYNNSTSDPPVSVTVAQASTITMLVASPTSLPAGQSATFTASISTGSTGVAPTGTVTFYDSGVSIGSASVGLSGMSYQAAFSTSGLSVGSHNITASYSGDSNFIGSSGGPTSVSVY